MSRYLIGLDQQFPSRDLLAVCTRLLSADDEAIVVTVIPPHSTAVARRHPLLGGWIRPLEALARQEREAGAWALIQRAGAALCDSGAAVEMHVCHGHDPAAVLMKLAVARAADGIVIGAPERSGWRRLLPSRVTRRLIAGAPCPVIVARALPAHAVEHAASQLTTGGRLR